MADCTRFDTMGMIPEPLHCHWCDRERSRVRLLAPTMTQKLDWSLPEVICLDCYAAWWGGVSRDPAAIREYVLAQETGEERSDGDQS